MAVGETGDEREIANLTIIKEKVNKSPRFLVVYLTFMPQVNSTFEMEESIPLLRSFFFKRWNASKRKGEVDEEMLREYEANNKAILQEIEVR